MAVYHATRQRQSLGFGGSLGSSARSALIGGAGTLRAPGLGVRSAAPSLADASASASASGAVAGASPAALDRRRTRVVVRAGRRSEGRVGLVLGGIVVAFLLAFFSLAQTVRVSATGYDIDRLLVDRQRLEAQRQELLNDLTRLGREPAIRKGAIAAGLSPLVEPVIVNAR